MIEQYLYLLKEFSILPMWERFDENICFEHECVMGRNFVLWKNMETYFYFENNLTDKYEYEK